ncbi:MAG: hypothetical protein ACOYXC_02420, partial [Candidatus Rifleibacteriota bacterium]
MANCNICNKEIDEGYICNECANSQRNQQTPPQQKSGFSLNGLLKTQAPKPASTLPTTSTLPPSPRPAPLPPIAPNTNTQSLTQAPPTINPGGSLPTPQPVVAPPPVAPAVPAFTPNPVPTASPAAVSPGFPPNQSAVSTPTPTSTITARLPAKPPVPSEPPPPP